METAEQVTKSPIVKVRRLTLGVFMAKRGLVTPNGDLAWLLDEQLDIRGCQLSRSSGGVLCSIKPSS